METILEYTINISGRRKVSGMSMAQQVLDYRKKINENQRQIREMVMESYWDIAAGKGRDCNELFEELEKRYVRNRV